jgi:hypothetical protein
MVARTLLIVTALVEMPIGLTAAGITDPHAEISNRHPQPASRKTRTGIRESLARGNPARRSSTSGPQLTTWLRAADELEGP